MLQKIHRVIIQQETGFKGAAEMMTILIIGLMKHMYNVHISEPESDRNSPHDSYVGPSSDFKY